MGLSNSAVRIYGDSAVAAIGVVTRIMAIGTYVVFGFMKGLQPVAGYNYGAKNYNRLNEAIKVSLKWSTVFCAAAAQGSYVSRAGHCTAETEIQEVLYRTGFIQLKTFCFLKGQSFNIFQKDRNKESLIL